MEAGIECGQDEDREGAGKGSERNREKESSGREGRRDEVGTR